MFDGARSLRVLVLLVICRVSCYDGPAVITPLGEVNGYFMETRAGRKISAFTSIPYALPPLGELRFKAPVPVDGWKDALDATKETPVCVQRNPYIRQKDIVGQEDCLYLNIYTPYINTDIPTVHLLPVMVFIHGGGWMCGDATTKNYGPEFLLDRDILLVTINYRLGPLGFLSTQDEQCPGNNGLKDQQVALKFIQQVIESFGGDKNSITIFGESAGGASVHYHMLSKSSSGLFHKGISQSGTAFVPWAESPPGESLRNAFKLAKFLGCPQAPSKNMIKCLRTKDSYDIIGTEFSFYDWDYEPMTPFKAVVEPDLPGAFLTTSIRKITNLPSPVPWMTGLTTDEGCLKSVWLTSNESRYNEFISGFDTIAPITFYYENSPYVEGITKKIKETYLKDKDTIKSEILNVYSDSYFAYPAVEGVEHSMKYSKGPVFLYQLSYRGANSFSQIFGDPDGNYGVCHADDLMYLFPIYFLDKPSSEKDLEMSSLIINLWTNFATTGNPNKPIKIPFRWEPVTCTGKMQYLDIGEQQKMKNGFASRSRFWDTLPLWHKKGKKPYREEL